MKQAIVLAGGFGTRLRSVVSDVPKPMASIAGRPFLELLLGHLVSNGFERIVLSVGYLSEAIVAHFGDAFRGVPIAYAVESEPLGTGGAIRAALAHCERGHVYVLNGDTYLAVDTAATDALWAERGLPIIVARAVDDTARYGKLEVDASGRIRGFLEKDASGGPGLINAGCYVLPTDIADEFPASERFSFETEYLRDAVGRREFLALPTDAEFIDIGTPEDYARAQILLSAHG
ncbi:nucleotidyltransferase family protein [Lysobacter sp. 5GHs7-4]|uniref:nucleotidyltransferase family protein n=1 Tax=Lysobacter sp. 5GHs7-4 TaxID=2904253 RepID=UPI001E4D1855|nr:nucleotidyltransferase family protein [Lysobacter sp. 5GHs7-4]UHQ22685.1 nucleotidyltransferase family protein [Lysobacter sp. 5GHs7-4]